MSNNVDVAEGAMETSHGLSTQSNNTQLWSPWNFWKKERPWQQLFYGEIPLGTSQSEGKHVLFTGDKF